MICPKCGENKAHRSHRAGVQDHVRRLFQMIPYRCRACQHRFYAYRAGEKSSKLRTTEERKIMELRRRLKWKQSRRILAIAGLGILALIAILYAVIQQRVVTE
ncbi:MAG TPA: hypothetical protein VHB50_07485 [Bryobacteraceae bacterium]|nr:hypothetical protein [Bryobacteraceae bacterium]